MIRLFHNGRAVIHHGDSRDVLRMMPDCSVDSIVTDPPYALVSIVKRFGAPNAAPGRDVRAESGPYTRASAGFMGQTWDTGETAFAVEFWAQCLRVLRPGGHVIAFSGTRTYHRLACAIEDAGFEIRDQLAWCYGTGFPKSHDVSKGIDKRRGWAALPRLQVAIREARKALGISQSEAARRAGIIGPAERLGGGGYMWFETGMRAPTREQWPQIKTALRIGDEFDACFEEVEREITGTVDEWSNRSNYALTSKDGFRRDKPASDLARKWAGWGTALKPAWEPIALGRKPLIGTVAENVLALGTGAINIGACRVPGEGGKARENEASMERRYTENGSTNFAARPGPRGGDPLGKFPANILHDGSPEVSAAFGFYANGVERFFYSAKADKIDRAGSGHPTVKPVDVMRWCVRLVTPPGGTVLEPFAGSGTTAEACLHEGFRCIAIEREAKFFDDTCARVDAWRQLPAARRDRADYVRAEAEAAARAALYDGALL